MKWIALALMLTTHAHARCTDMVVAQWRLSLSEKSVSLVNFAPQSVKICRDEKAPVKWMFEVKKGRKLESYAVDLPQLPKGVELKTSDLDLYFEAPLPVWAKRSQLRVIDHSDMSVLATGEMK
jgi:hypothetical protein